MVKRATWLSITPEPERELPWAVATLRGGGRPSDLDVGRERAQIEALLLHGNERSWLAYLHAVIGLIDERGDASSEEVARARALARAVIYNHHQLLLGLPGSAAALTAADRAHLHDNDEGGIGPR